MFILDNQDHIIKSFKKNNKRDLKDDFDDPLLLLEINFEDNIM
jgi:hypothetical protein